MDKKWKYDDKSCSGCKINEETGEEIMRCKDLGDNLKVSPTNAFLKISLNK